MYWVPRRVGRLDAALRMLIGTTLLGIAAFAFGALPSDWSFSLVLVLVLGGYLLLTGVSGADPFYNALDYTTNERWRRRARGEI